MSRHERDLLREMPMKGKGEGAKEGKESLQMAVQIHPL